MRRFCVVSIFFIVFFTTSFTFLLYKPHQDVFAESSTCNFNSGAAYPLGDTTNAQNKSFDGNSSDFYQVENNYYFVTQDDTLDISKSFFTQSQADGNGYDVYPKLASVVGFIPDRLVNAYHLKHKFKNDASTGDNVPFPKPLGEIDITQGSDIKVPASGYNILWGFNPPKGQGTGPAGLLMWTNGNSFVFQIGRADNPRNIFFYVFDVCVDQSLVDAYNKANVAGRAQLPELTAGQVIAKAKYNRIRLGVRDNGVFLDTRSPYVWDSTYEKSLDSNTSYSGYPITKASSDKNSINPQTTSVVRLGWPAMTVPSASTQNNTTTQTGQGGGSGGGNVNTDYTMTVSLDDSQLQQFNKVFFSHSLDKAPVSPYIRINVHNSTNTVTKTEEVTPQTYTDPQRKLLQWQIPFTIGESDSRSMQADIIIAYSKDTQQDLCSGNCKSQLVQLDSSQNTVAATIPITNPFVTTYIFSIPNENTEIKDFFATTMEQNKSSISACFQTNTCLPAILEGPISKDSLTLYTVTVSDAGISQKNLLERSRINCLAVNSKKYCFR